jgi:hypothetical protein
MPERCSNIPISVKKGIASSDSLAMMNSRRIGSAAISCSGSAPSSTPRPPKSRPQAISASTTGTPLASSGTRARSISGARFAANASITGAGGTARRPCG